MKLLISSSQKLLGMILLNNKFDFDEYVTSLCRKASQKLNALARVAFYMNLSQRRLMMNIVEQTLASEERKKSNRGGL